MPFSPLTRLNFLVFDAYQQLRPRAAAESSVLVVDIDDDSIRQIGQWPWSRTMLAQMIDRLAEHGAATIGLDIILSEPDRTSPALAVAQLERQGFQVTYPGASAELDHDRILAASFANAPVVAGLVLAETVNTPPPLPKAGFAFAGDNPSLYLPAYPGSVPNLAILDEAAPGIGVFSFPPALDGVVRAGAAAVALPRQALPGTVGRGAARRAGRVELHRQEHRRQRRAGHRATRHDGAEGRRARSADGRRQQHLGLLCATDPRQACFPPRSSSPQTPIPRCSRQIEGRIVLIGTSAIGLRDLVSTPLTAGLPGVLVHAEIIDQIVSGTFITRPDWAAGLEVVLAIGLTIAVLAFLPWFSHPGQCSGRLPVRSTLSVAVGWIAFANHSLLISPILPALACLLAYGVASGVRLLLSESESRYIRSAFSHYLSPAMVERLVEQSRRAWCWAARTAN